MDLKQFRWLGHSTERNTERTECSDIRRTTPKSADSRNHTSTKPDDNDHKTGRETQNSNLRGQ
jgi:hypothetical protein